MAQRRSSASDGGPSGVRQRKGRCSIPGDESEQHNDGCIGDSDVGELDEHKSVKCDLPGDVAKNESPLNLSSTSASPQSSKRRHKPNTMYGNDFVFGSVKRSKLQKCESQPGSKQIVLSANEMKKALLERKPTGSSSEKTAKSEKKMNFPSTTSDLTSSEDYSFDVKRQGRKPKCDNESSLTEVENVESGNLPSKLNLSSRGVHPMLGEKSSTGIGRKPHSANTSLSDEHLRVGIDSSFDRTEVPSSVPRKRGRPPKIPASKILPITGKRDAKRNLESSLAQNGNVASENSPSSLNYTSTPHTEEKGRDKRPKFKNISSQDEQSKTDSEFSSVETELPLSGLRKRGRPLKKSVDENVRRTSEDDAEHYESCLTENGNMNYENVPCSLNLSQSDIFAQLKEKANIERGRTSDVADNSLPNEHLGIDSDSCVINKVPLTVPRRHGRPPKKLTCEDYAAIKGSVHINLYVYQLCL